MCLASSDVLGVVIIENLRTLASVHFKGETNLNPAAQGHLFYLQPP